MLTSEQLARYKVVDTTDTSKEFNLGQGAYSLICRIISGAWTLEFDIDGEGLTRVWIPGGQDGDALEITQIGIYPLFIDADLILRLSGSAGAEFYVISDSP